MPALRALQVAILIVIDLATFYTALVLAILFRIYLFPGMPDDRVYSIKLYWDHLYIWWLPTTFILTIAYESLYQKRQPYWQESWHMLKAISLAMLLIFAYVSLSKSESHVSRVVLVSLWAGAIVLSPIYRALGKGLFRKLGIWHEDVLILGAGDAGMATLRGLERETSLGYRVIGFLDDDASKVGMMIQTPLAQYRVFGTVKHFRKFVNRLGISTIIIAMPSLDPLEQATLVSEVQRYVSRVLLVPELRGIALMNTELSVLFMEQLFLLKIRNNLKSLYAQIIKRIFDILISSLALISLSWLFGILYLAVRLTSPGGAFFIQHRPGKNGRIIRIYKFRTMYIDGDKRLQQALARDSKLADEWHVYRKLKSYDPRVTSVGKFLRKWSMDELPQIFNVFKGEMSIVGPRPYMISEIESLKEAADVILMAKPGLCGLWQASGRNNLSFEDRVKLECWYVLNWALWLDMILMLKTAKGGLTAEGAY